MANKEKSKTDKKTEKYSLLLAKTSIAILLDETKRYLKTHKFDVALMLMTVWGLLIIWTITPSIEKTYIPTIVNGASSTTALLLAFVGLLFTVSFSYLHISPQKMKSRLFWTIAGCSSALGLIGGAYASYLTTEVNFYMILKLSISAVLITILLASTLARYIYTLIENST